MKSGGKKRPKRPAKSKAKPRGKAWRPAPLPSAETNHDYAQIQRLCLSLPETSEKIAWGRPTFRVRGKMFVMFMDNHHNDGRVAIWCAARPGVQKSLVVSNPDVYFVPPYVGPSGWIGVRLDRELDWARVAEHIDDAHRAIAPDLAAGS